ncbi:ABC transporter substrate-binding protein [Geomonas limicola]|uniref:ABC transporter substrate-binding protein n=1 Tax=Geomonas limicola TaxID=2740186 RepID=A0A6V8ND25_9BACT|nr:ABC transporter substrate-binding protein [Geomonas limicola]GFO70535.1 ABC transporter substrate-binding protein [Geomonas limicola]
MAALLPAADTRAAGKLVAALLTCDIPRYRDAHRAFVKALVQKGYDQSNIEVITQTPNPDPISWANSIRKFNAIGADLIVTYGAPATMTALHEAGDVPVVFADVYGPVEAGVARSLTSTGHNMAGVSCKVPLVTLVKTALEIKPIKELGVVYTGREEGSMVQLKELRKIAAQYGVILVEVNLAGTSGIDAALATMFNARVEGIYVTECTAGSRGFEKIVHRAAESKIPTFSQMPGAAQKGALLSLEADPAEQGQVAADYAARILGGKKAATLPVATPKKVELVVNMKVARALDLHVPFPVLSAATRVLK